MKKFISIVLLVTLCLGLFAGCNKSEDPVDTSADLANAKLILRNRYDTAAKGQDNKILADKELITTVAVGDNVYKVEWSVKVTSGNADDAKIVAAETANTVKLDINAEPDEELKFVLTATISDDAGNSVTLDINCMTPVPEGKAPTEGKAYKLALTQLTLGKVLAFNGEMNGKYLATTENESEAVDVFVEKVDGVEDGYRIYFMAGETKTYIDTVLREDDNKKTDLKLVTEPTCVYIWNPGLGIFLTKVGDNEFFLGTYKDYNTISTSRTYYITGENEGNFCKTQYAAFLVEKLPEAPAADNKDDSTGGDSNNGSSNGGTGSVAYKPYTETPVADTAYKFALYQKTLGKTYYATGEMSDNFLATSDNSANAADLYVETVTGGYKLYFKVNEAKKYINVYEYEKGGKNKNSQKLVDSTDEATVFVWNTELHIFTTTQAKATYYLGTYDYYKDNALSNSYSTIGSSKIDYITGNNASKVGESQFPAYLYVVDPNGSSNSGSTDNGTTGGTTDNGGNGVTSETTPDGATKLTVSIKDYADKNGWKNATQYTQLVMDSNITVTVAGQSGGKDDDGNDYAVNTGKYYEKGENWRIYQKESPSIVIKAADGKTIASVKITYAIEKTGVLTKGEENIASGTEITVNANSITLSVGNTGTVDNGQVRITAIEVIYA